MALVTRSSLYPIEVADAADFNHRFARSFADGGMFIPTANPHAVGSEIQVHFVLPDGRVLCRANARVLHARIPVIAADRTAGMAVQFSVMDGVAQALSGKPSADAPRREPVVERLGHGDTTIGVHSGPMIGVDLGTTNSCVAIADKGIARVLVTAQGYETIPSVVVITADKQVFVGQQAADKMLLHPGRAIYGSKRFMGRPYASMEVDVYGHFFAYELALGKAGLTAAKLQDLVIPLEVVSGFILMHAKKVAEENLQQVVSRAVITVPAYFSETQRQSVRDAARMAGLHVERIMTEPTAAAVAYGYSRGLHSTVLVYDLGGGTFDASLLRVHGDQVEVLATDGDPFLGGSDFDDRLTQAALNHVRRTHGIDLQDDLLAMQRLRLACEQAKRALSSADTAPIEVPHIAQTAGGPVHLSWSVSRGQFEELCSDLIDRTLVIVQQTLDRANIKASAVDDVILAGGQSRVPRIRALLAERFGKRPSHHVHPEHAVALGAALVAESLARPGSGKVQLIDILPASIRLVLNTGKTSVLLHRGTQLPAEIGFDVQFSAATRNAFSVSLCRGEHTLAEKNQPLGTLRFDTSVLPSVAGATLRMTVQVNEEGIIRVTASNSQSQVRHELALVLGDNTPPTVDTDELAVVSE